MGVTSLAFCKYCGVELNCGKPTDRTVCQGCASSPIDTGTNIIGLPMILFGIGLGLVLLVAIGFL